MSNKPAPAAHAAAITPGSAELTVSCDALYIGGAGDIEVTMEGGETVTFVGLAAGDILPISVKVVKGTAATTATSIIALWY